MKFNEAVIDDPKWKRGYGEFYDLLLGYTGTDINMCELGIGGGGSHERWSQLTTGNIIGVDIKDSSVYVASVPDNRFITYWETEAFTPEMVKTIKEHDVRFVIDDSKHNTLRWKQFHEHYVGHFPILIKEEIGRNIANGTECIEQNQIIQAIDSGWTIYSFTDDPLNKMSDKSETFSRRASVIGVYTSAINDFWLDPLEYRKVTKDNIDNMIDGSIIKK